MERYYRYTFEEGVDLKSIQESLFLSCVAVESLVGRAAMRMDLSFDFDQSNRMCFIDAGLEVGQKVARIFTGFLLREVDPDMFDIDRTDIGCGEAFELKKAIRQLEGENKCLKN